MMNEQPEMFTLFVRKIYNELVMKGIQIYEYEENFIKIIDSTSFGMVFNYEKRTLKIELDSDMMNDLELFECDVNQAKELLEIVYSLIWESGFIDKIIISNADIDQEFPEVVINNPNKVRKRCPY